MEVEEENVVLQAVMDPIRVGSDVARRLASSTAGDDSSLNDFAMMSNPDLFADQIARKQVSTVFCPPLSETLGAKECRSPVRGKDFSFFPRAHC